MIKAGSAALRYSVGPAGATFDEEGKPVRHSGGGDSGRGRAGRWLGGQGRVGGRDVRLWGESSWCCSSRGPSGKTGNTYSQMSIVVVESWMRCIWSICLVAKSGVLECWSCDRTEVAGLPSLPSVVGAPLSGPIGAPSGFTRSVACKVSAQVSVPTPRLFRMPLSKADALWYQRRFDCRCERIADILNRPAFRFLRETGMVPFPPHAGLNCGQRAWHAACRSWREYGYKLAVALGFCEQGPPTAASGTSVEWGRDSGNGP